MICPFWGTGHEDIRPVSVVDILNLGPPHISELSGTEKQGLNSGGLNSQMKTKAFSICATKDQGLGKSPSHQGAKICLQPSYLSLSSAFVR